MTEGGRTKGSIEELLSFSGSFGKSPVPFFELSVAKVDVTKIIFYL